MILPTPRIGGEACQYNFVRLWDNLEIRVASMTKANWTKSYPVKPGWYKFSYVTHDAFSHKRVRRILFIEIVKDKKIKGTGGPMTDKTLKGLRCNYKAFCIPIGSLVGLYLDCYWWSKPERLPKAPEDEKA